MHTKTKCILLGLAIILCSGRQAHAVPAEKTTAKIAQPAIDADLPALDKMLDQLLDAKKAAPAKSADAQREIASMREAKSPSGTLAHEAAADPASAASPVESVALNADFIGPVQDEIPPAAMPRENLKAADASLPETIAPAAPPALDGPMHTTQPATLAMLSQVEPALAQGITVPAASAKIIIHGVAPSANEPGKANVNADSAMALHEKLGVDMTRANLIVEFRTLYGKFKNADDLDQVVGITTTMVDAWTQADSLRY